MPRKPKKPCAYPGCPRLTEGRYCEKHQKERNAQYEKYGRDHKTTKRRYGKNWQVINDRIPGDVNTVGIAFWRCEINIEHRKNPFFLYVHIRS